MLVLFVPVVQFLVAGASSLTVPFEILLDSVLVFIVVPLTTGTLLRLVLLGRQGKERLRRSVAEVCSGDDGGAAADARADLRLPGGEHHQQIFPRRTDRRADHIAGLFERVLAYRLMSFSRWTFRCAPGALIGASNFSSLRLRQQSRSSVPNREQLWQRSSVYCGSAGDALRLHGLNRTRTGSRFLRKRYHDAKEKSSHSLYRQFCPEPDGGRVAPSRCGDRFEVESAGTRPGQVRPEAIAVMNEIGIDLSAHRSKHVDEFTNQAFDYVLTVCDNAKESCPTVPDTAP